MWFVCELFQTITEEMRLCKDTKSIDNKWKAKHVWKHEIFTITFYLKILLFTKNLKSLQKTEMKWCKYSQ